MSILPSSLLKEYMFCASRINFSEPEMLDSKFHFWEKNFHFWDQIILFRDLTDAKIERSEILAVKIEKKE